MPVPVLPDAIAVTREALLAQSPLTALVSTRMYDRIPASPIWPLLVLEIVDDLELDPHTSQARVQVNVWGRSGSPTDAAEALNIARVVRAVARDLRGSWAAGDVSNSAPTLIVPAPDPVTGRARYLLDLLIQTNP